MTKKVSFTGTISDAISDCWVVYIVECQDESLYTGITNNLQARIASHNNGTAARYTRSRLPVKLLYFEPHSDRSSASKREWEIKKLSRAKKLELIVSLCCKKRRNDFDI